MQEYNKIKFINDTAGRLDQITAKFLEKPRNQLENLIKKSGIMVGELCIKKGGFKLIGGESITIEFPDTTKSEAQEIDFDVEILYEDEHLLVINKPSGLIVHPAPSVREPTLVDWLKHRGISLSTLSGEERHGIVHRIDKETTGALIIAKNNDAHTKLSAQLEDKSMGRFYLALLDLPLKEDVIVEASIFRSKTNRLKMAINEEGRWAKSEFKKIALSQNEREELIAAKLYTGRTHQIRVHLENLQRHILGDTLYGYSKDKKEIRVMLHAYILYFVHPVTQKLVYVKAPLMDDFKEILHNRYKNVDDTMIEGIVKNAFIST